MAVIGVLRSAARSGQSLRLRGRRQRHRAHEALAALATATDGFSGAEIEQAVVSALYAAHAAERGLDDALVLEEINATRPLSVVMREQVTALREWAAGRTVPAD